MLCSRGPTLLFIILKTKLLKLKKPCEVHHIRTLKNLFVTSKFDCAQGVVQYYFPLAGDESGVKITVAKYLTPLR